MGGLPRHFQVLHVAPRSLAMDQFGFVETVYRLGEGVVIRVTDTADRRFDASLSQTLGISNGQILGGFNRSSQHLRSYPV